MPIVRLYPVLDVGPNEFTPGGVEHFSRLDESISSPDLSDGVRVQINDKTERFRLTDIPDDVDTITNLTIYLHHHMRKGNGFLGMGFRYIIYVDGVQVATTSSSFPNDFGPLTDTFSHPVSVTPSPGVVEVELTTELTSPDDWAILPAQWNTYTINVDMEYTAIISPDVSAMSGVIVVNQAADYTTANGAWQYTNVLPNMPFIPGTQLPAGSKWLVWYHATHGAALTGFFSRQSETTFVSGSTSAYLLHGYSSFKGVVHGSPDPIHGGTLNGWFIYTGDGTDLRFGLRALSSISTTWSGMQIIAIPLATLVEGGQSDYFFGQDTDIFGDPVDLSVAAGAPAGTIRSLSYGNPRSGNWLLLASCEDKNTVVADGARVRLIKDGNLLREWLVETQDTRDRFSFTYAGVVSFTGAGAIALEGSDAKGTGTKVFTRARIILIRLDSFGSYSYVTQAANTAISAIQPGWQTALSVTHNLNNAEYVLIVGGMTAWRPEAACLMSRLINNGTGLAICPFSTVVNVGNLDFDRQALMSVAVETVNSVQQYSMQVQGESGYAATGSYRDAWLVALGLSTGTAPGSHVIDVMDTTACSDKLSGDLPQGIGLSDSSPMTDSYAMVVTGTGPSIPIAHPRIWLYNNDRLSYMRTQAGYNDVGVQVNPPGSSRWQDFVAHGQVGSREFFTHVIKYTVTQAAADLATVNADIDGLAAGSMGTIMGDSDGLEWRETVRSLAFAYDWMNGVLDSNRKKKLEDLMLASLYCRMHPTEGSNPSAITASILANPPSNVTKMTTWALSSPTNNFFSAYMMASTYIAIALYHENITTFQWPPVTGTTYQFSVNYNPGITSSQLFSGPTAVFDWLIARMEGIALPVWDSYADGGQWPEGQNYGPAALRHQTELACILRDSANLNYIGQHPYFLQMMLFELYEQQPGNSMMIHLGDAPRDRFLYVNDYIRHLLLMSVYAFQGSAESSYVQWWANNQSGPMGTTAPQMRGLEFMLWNGTYNSADYRSILPTHYHGGGFVNSRSDWTTGAYSITFTSTDFLEEHQHEDQNHIQIYSGVGVDGWILCDPRPFETSDVGEIKTAIGHNTYDVDGWGQAYRAGAASGELCGFIARFIGAPKYTYAQGNCNGAYYTKNSKTHVSTPQSKMNDVFLREFVHVHGTGVAYVLAYDRFRLLPAYSALPVVARWQYPHTQPIVEDTSTVSHTVGTTRLFRRDLLNGASSRSFTDWGNPDVWREDISVSMTSGYGRLFTMFEVCTNATGAMVATNAIVNAGGTMEGVTIKDPGGWTHVAFTTVQNGVAGSTMYYDVTKNASSDTHLVVNLLPNVRYLITEGAVGGGVYRYTLTQGAGGKLTTQAGTLEFTPAAMSGTSHVIELQDSTHVVTESNSIVQSHKMFPTDTSALSDVFLMNIPNHHIILGFDTTALSDVMTIPMFSMLLRDTTAGVDSMELTSISGTPGTTYIEKRITLNLPSVYPNEDRGASFIDTEPSDNVVYTKWLDSSDETFVKFLQSSFSSLAVVGLDDISSYVKKILGVRLFLRVRRHAAGQAVSPTCTVFLANESLSVIYATFTTNLVTSENPVEYASSVMQVNIPEDLTDSAVLAVRPGSVGGGNVGWILEISQARLDLYGDPAEKVIE